MRITLDVLGSQPKQVEADLGYTLDDLLDEKGIDQNDGTFVLINGRPQNGYQELRDGDTVTIAKSVVGG